MYKAAVIGDYDSIYGFACAGLDIISVSNDAECEEAFKKAASKNYAAVFVTENYAQIVIPLAANPIPALMLIPLHEGESYGEKELHSMVEKAAGADIL